MDRLTLKGRSARLGLAATILLASLLLSACNGSEAPSLAPMAQDDQASVDDDAALLLDVLANDQAGSDAKLSAVGTPAHGQVRIEGRQIRYRPEPGYAGTDAFSYQLSDGSGRSSSAQVKLTLRQSLSLEGSLTEAQPLADMVIEATQDGAVLASTRTDAQGRFTLKLYRSGDGGALLRLRSQADKSHPRSHHEGLLGSWSALHEVAGTTRRIPAQRLSALNLGPAASAEAALYLRYQQALDGAADFANENALRAAMQAYSTQAVAEGAALAQLLLDGRINTDKDPGTVWDMLADSPSMRQFRAAAQTQLGAQWDELLNQAQAELGRGMAFAEEELPLDIVLAGLDAYQQAPLFQPIKDSMRLSLQRDGSGRLQPRQSFEALHAALRWQLDGKGVISLRGSGTEVAAGTGIYDDPYHVHLLLLRRLGRTVYGDQVLAQYCGGLTACTLDDEDLALIESVQLSLPAQHSVAFEAAELPGRWMLPTAPDLVVDAHFGAGRLRAAPLELRADGSVAGSELRWRLEAGDLLLIDAAGQQQWRLSRYQRSDAQQQLVRVQYQGPKGQGFSLGEAYRLDDSLRLDASALQGEWRIARLLRDLQLRGDGSATLLTHHDRYDGRWRLEQGVMIAELSNADQSFRLRWFAIQQGKGKLLVLESGEALDGSSEFVPAAFRYELALPSMAQVSQVPARPGPLTRH